MRSFEMFSRSVLKVIESKNIRWPRDVPDMGEISNAHRTLVASV
jgi:hypothetical protein